MGFVNFYENLVPYLAGYDKLIQKRTDQRVIKQMLYSVITTGLINLFDQNLVYALSSRKRMMSKQR